MSFGHTGSSTIVPSALSYLLPNIGAPVISPRPNSSSPTLIWELIWRTERWGMLPTTEAVAPTHARLMKSVGLMWMLYSVPTMWRATVEGGGRGGRGQRRLRGGGQGGHKGGHTPLVIASSRSDSKVTSQPQ